MLCYCLFSIIFVYVFICLSRFFPNMSITSLRWTVCPRYYTPKIMYRAANTKCTHLTYDRGRFNGQQADKGYSVPTLA